MVVALLEIASIAMTAPVAVLYNPSGYRYTAAEEIELVVETPVEPDDVPPVAPDDVPEVPDVPDVLPEALDKPVEPEVPVDAVVEGELV